MLRAATDCNEWVKSLHFQRGLCLRLIVKGFWKRGAVRSPCISSCVDSASSELLTCRPQLVCHSRQWSCFAFPQPTSIEFSSTAYSLHTADHTFLFVDIQTQTMFPMRALLKLQEDLQLEMLKSQEDLQDEMIDVTEKDLGPLTSMILC